MPVILKTFHKFDVTRSSKNPVLSDLHCQKAPTVAVRIFGQSLFSRYLVESQATPRNARRIRKQAEIKLRCLVTFLISKYQSYTFTLCKRMPAITNVSYR